MNKDMYQLWVDKELPGEYQKKVDAFATAQIESFYELEIFRAGFYCGMKCDEIKAALHPGETDAGL